MVGKENCGPPTRSFEVSHSVLLLCNVFPFWRSSGAQLYVHAGVCHLRSRAQVLVFMSEPPCILIHIVFPGWTPVWHHDEFQQKGLCDCGKVMIIAGHVLEPGGNNTSLFLRNHCCQTRVYFNIQRYTRLVPASKHAIFTRFQGLDSSQRGPADPEALGGSQVGEA
jgi:hypothetical protein